jgi:hypothetical protein
MGGRQMPDRASLPLIINQEAPSSSESSSAFFFMYHQ